MASDDMTGVDANMTGVDANMTGVDANMTGVDANMTGVDANMTGDALRESGLDQKAAGEQQVQEQERVHRVAQKWIAMGKVKEALALLMAEEASDH
jgi:hypothetical protein